MAHEPTRKPSFREMIEACGPEHEEGLQPEMVDSARKPADSPQRRAQHERLRLLDSDISAVFRDVPVPAGLQERILARLSAKGAPLVDAHEERSLARDGRESGGARAAALRASRRRWLYAVSGLAATAAGLLWVVLGLLPRGESFSKTELMAAAIERFLNDSADRGFVLAASPSRYPLSQSLLDLAAGQIAVVRWRSLDGFFGGEAEAFDLIGPHGRVATVYAGRFPVAGLPAEVPPRPMLSTAETSASAWREHDVVYVLVVAGGDHAYERLVGFGAGPLA